jgi:hypothetical protein
MTLDVFSNSIMPGGLTLSAWEARVLGQLGDHPNIATVLAKYRYSPNKQKSAIMLAMRQAELYAEELMAA